MLTYIRPIAEADIVFTGRCDRRTPFRDKYGALPVADAVNRVAEESVYLNAETMFLWGDIMVGKGGRVLATQKPKPLPMALLVLLIGGKRHSFPSSSYDSLAGNLAAVAAHLNAVRGIERWGVGTVEQMMEGFKELPPKGDVPHWAEVLGVARWDTDEYVRMRWQELVLENHPDKGGNRERFDEIQQAWAEFKSARRLA